MDDRRDPDPYTTHAPPTRIIMFLLCFALLAGGFYVMAISFDTESSLLFVLGLLMACVAFVIPMRNGRS